MQFLDESFLLSNDVSQRLYFDYAESQPIYDFHCHLSPKDIAENRAFQNLTEAWLEGDHYKWRAMRAAGVSEHLITGDSSPEEKFMAWAETVPQTLRNPLYHWTHLELKRYFGETDLLDAKSAKEIYERSNEILLETPINKLLSDRHVELICTVEDPVDDLRYHKQLRKDGYPISIHTTFRPDAVLGINDPDHFTSYISELSNATGIVIRNFDLLLEALNARMLYFHENGCRLADHGLETLYAEPYSIEQLNGSMQRAFQGLPNSPQDTIAFKSAVLFELSKMYHSLGWSQLFHLGALRNTNTRLRNALGADCGTDSIGDFPQATNMYRFFDRLDRDNKLAPTVIFNLNPADNEVFASMVGNYNDGTMPGKMQYGSGWWFLDQKDGMQKQMNALSNLGLLSRFIGMVTDSRSFLSYPRHEYFRRILCDLIGRDVENGELPYEMDLLGSMVQDICYNNAKNFFAFDSHS